MSSTQICSAGSAWSIIIISILCSYYNINCVFWKYSWENMGDSEQKALELMAQAEKKLKSSGGFFGSLMGQVFCCVIFSSLLFTLGLMWVQSKCCYYCDAPILNMLLELSTVSEDKAQCITVTGGRLCVRWTRSYRY